MTRSRTPSAIAIRASGLPTTIKLYQRPRDLPQDFACSHHVRSGRPPAPSSRQAAGLQPASPTTPASPPAHPRHVNPKPIRGGTNPIVLHALLVEELSLASQIFVSF